MKRCYYINLLLIFLMFNCCNNNKSDQVIFLGVYKKGEEKLKDKDTLLIIQNKAQIDTLRKFLAQAPPLNKEKVTDLNFLYNYSVDVYFHLKGEVTKITLQRDELDDFYFSGFYFIYNNKKFDGDKFLYFIDREYTK